MTVPLIEALDLWYTYMRGTPLETVSLRGVSLTVAPGEIIAVIGPTGSGKSTLLQHLNGLLRPQSGTVHVAGLDLADPRTDMRQVRLRVALLFQNPGDQLFEPYVADDVAYGPLQMGLPRDEVRARVRRALGLVGLPVEQFGDRLTMGLSGGERRRAALAGILALEPAVLVLDEPMAGLDPCGRREMLALLDSWRRQEGRAVVWATHAMDQVAGLADRVYVLAEGAVVLQGSPREVFAHDAELLALGLDLPPIRRVLEDLSRAGFVPHVDAITVEEAVSALESLL